MRIKEGRQCQEPGGAQYPQQSCTGYADHFHQCPGEVLYAGECDPVLCDDDHVCLDRVFDLQHGTSRGRLDESHDADIVWIFHDVRHADVDLQISVRDLEYEL